MLFEHLRLPCVNIFYDVSPFFVVWGFQDHQWGIQDLFCVQWRRTPFTRCSRACVGLWTVFHQLYVFGVFWLRLFESCDRFSPFCVGVFQACLPSGSQKQTITTTGVFFFATTLWKRIQDGTYFKSLTWNTRELHSTITKSQHPWCTNWSWPAPADSWSFLEHAWR